LDRNARFVLGGGALVAGLFGGLRLPWRLLLLGFGASELITASTRYCPLNEALGVNTAREGLKPEIEAAAHSLAE